MDKWQMEIFTLSGCDYCKSLEQGLKLLGITYNNINVTNNDFLADKLEETYQCESYPMIILKGPLNKIWLPESSLLPSPQIRIYNSIPQLLEQIKQIYKNEI
jgi:glutaredoxin